MNAQNTKEEKKKKQRTKKEQEKEKRRHLSKSRWSVPSGTPQWWELMYEDSPLWEVSDSIPTCVRVCVSFKEKKVSQGGPDCRTTRAARCTAVYKNNKYGSGQTYQK